MDEYSNGNHTRQLTRRQRDALPHLLAPGTISEKARNAGISRPTLYRWLRNIEFRRRLEEACEDAMSLSDAQLQLASHKAVAVLLRSLDDEKSHIRLRAAQSLVKLGHNTRFGKQLEERLSAIEDGIHIKEDFAYIVSNRWNKGLVYCRRAQAEEYLAKCWRDQEEPHPRRLTIAVCPWIASRRSWK